MNAPWSDLGYMLEEAEKRLVERQWLTVRILWVSVLAAQAAYIVVALAVGRDAALGAGGETGGPSWPVYLPRYVLGALAPVLLLAAWFVRRSAANPPKVISRFGGTYLNVVITAWALCEGVGVFGLADFFLEGEYLWLLVFVGISAAALVLLRPRKKELVDLAVALKLREGPPGGAGGG